MERLLICGDSFAADWTLKFKGIGWVNRLAQDYKITNLAQAGCSEYKILKQLLSIDINQFDLILISHTSPYRLHVEKHPVHFNDVLHNNSCFIYTDVLEHLPEHPELRPIAEYFDKYFDIEHAKFIHTLLLKEIDRQCDDKKTLHITHTIWDTEYKYNNFIDFNDVFVKNRGLINHYNEIGNSIVYTEVLRKLKNS